MNDTERLWAIVRGDADAYGHESKADALRAEMQRLQGEVANLRAIATTEGYEAHIEAYEATMTALQGENAELRGKRPCVVCEAIGLRDDAWEEARKAEELLRHMTASRDRIVQMCNTLREEIKTLVEPCRNAQETVDELMRLRATVASEAGCTAETCNALHLRAERAERDARKAQGLCDQFTERIAYFRGLWEDQCGAVEAWRNTSDQHQARAQAAEEAKARAEAERDDIITAVDIACAKHCKEPNSDRCVATKCDLRFVRLALLAAAEEATKEGDRE